MTPLFNTRFREWDIVCKAEYLLPSGSYKDRGIAVCLNLLSGWDVRTIAEDSSGNAGASTAAYAAAAGIHADIYVPENASSAKTNQIRIYGAQCHQIAGTRDDCAEEAQKAREDVYYIGHSWNPLFACGVKSVAYEIAEQSDWNLPDWVVTPAGGGSLVMGLIDGFKELLAAGYIQRLPKVLAVQSAACAPIYQAWIRHAPGVASVEPQQTCAEGVALPNPPRGNQVLQAIRDYRGAMVAVDDVDVLSCWKDLAKGGIFVEPTSAVAIAGAWQAKENRSLIAATESVLILLTGHGLKTKPSLM